MDHLVFPKSYASSERFPQHRHEQTYPSPRESLVAPRAPFRHWPVVLTGNRLHPTPESPRGASAACSDVLSPGPAWSLTRSAAPDPAWKRRVAKAGTCSGSNSTTDITGRQPARGVPFPGGRHEPKPRMGLFLCRSVDQATLMAPRAALRWRTDAACRFKTPRL